MDSQEKEQVVAELNQRFVQAGAAFLVKYQGCTCQELTGLRNDLKPAGAKFAVVKNTLASRAVKGTEAEVLADLFDGPTGVVWAGEDPIVSAKAVSTFAKGKEHFAIAGGVFEGKLLNGEDVQALAALPGKNELIANLLSLINAPATRLLQTINAPASSLARVLDGWRAKMEEGGEK